MKRKNRMKCTFINDVRPGTFWIRHNEYQLFKNFKFLNLEKSDVIMVLGFANINLNLIYVDMKLVECYSQKMNCSYETTLHDFYKNYRKL